MDKQSEKSREKIIGTIGYYFLQLYKVLLINIGKFVIMGNLNSCDTGIFHTGDRSVRPIAEEPLSWYRSNLIKKIIFTL